MWKYGGQRTRLNKKISLNAKWPRNCQLFTVGQDHQYRTRLNVPGRWKAPKAEIAKSTWTILLPLSRRWTFHRMMSVGFDTSGSDCHSENRRSLQSAFLPPISVVESKLGGADPDPLFPHLYYHWFKTFSSLSAPCAPSRLIFGHRVSRCRMLRSLLAAWRHAVRVPFRTGLCSGYDTCERSIMRAVESLRVENTAMNLLTIHWSSWLTWFEWASGNQGSWRVITFIATHHTW